MAGACAAAFAQERPLVLDGGTLVDVRGFGDSTLDIPDAVVILRDGRIAAAGPRDGIAIPADARVIDVRGRWLVPGLHDLFATLNNQGQADAFLAMGVTSIVGNDEPDGRRGPLFLDARPSPRVYRIEVIDGYDSSHIPPDQWTVAAVLERGRPLSDEALLAQLEALAAQGVRSLLLYYTLSAEQVRLVARKARELRLLTIGELGAASYPEAIEAGVMALVHTSRYSLELAPPELRSAVARAPFGKPRLKFYEALMQVRADSTELREYAAVLARSRVGLIPTLALNYLELPGHRNLWLEPAAALLDPADIHLPADRMTGNRQQPLFDVRDGFPPRTAEQLGMLESAYLRAGARYLAGSGTDAFGTLPGISLHIELEMLVQSGLTPRQALAAATGNVAELTPWPGVGRIEAGYNADLVVLDANPALDIGNLKRIHLVVLAGEVLDPKTLLGRRAER
jgi:Amidohydrolase family